MKKVNTNRENGPFRKVVGHLLGAVPLAAQIAVQICQRHSDANAGNDHPLPLECQEGSAYEKYPKQRGNDQCCPKHTAFKVVVLVRLLNNGIESIRAKPVAFAHLTNFSLFHCINFSYLFFRMYHHFFL